MLLRKSGFVRSTRHKEKELKRGEKRCKNEGEKKREYDEIMLVGLVLT